MLEAPLSRVLNQILLHFIALLKCNKETKVLNCTNFYAIKPTNPQSSPTNLSLPHSLAERTQHLTFLMNIGGINA